MRSPEFDALMVAVRGILDAELQHRRALLKLTEISDDEVLANAVRSRRKGFAAETNEIRRCADLLATGCSPDYGGFIDDETLIDIDVPPAKDEPPEDSEESEDLDWDLFLRR